VVAIIKRLEVARTAAQLMEPVARARKNSAPASTARSRVGAGNQRPISKSIRRASNARRNRALTLSLAARRQGSPTLDLLSLDLRAPRHSTGASLRNALLCALGTDRLTAGRISSRLEYAATTFAAAIFSMLIRV